MTSSVNNSVLECATILKSYTCQVSSEVRRSEGVVRRKEVSRGQPIISPHQHFEIDPIAFIIPFRAII
jgi:hypothetical protein